MLICIRERLTNVSLLCAQINYASKNKTTQNKKPSMTVNRKEQDEFVTKNFRCGLNKWIKKDYNIYISPQYVQATPNQKAMI